MDAVPRVSGVNRERGEPAAPMSGKGFGGGPGPVGKPREGAVKGDIEKVQESGVAAQPKTDHGKGEKKGGSECYLHGPFL